MDNKYSRLIKTTLDYLFYNSTKYGAIFSSSDVLYKTVKKYFPKLKIKKRDVENYLLKQSSYTRNRQTRSRFKTQKVIVGGINELHQADLIDLQNYQKDNDGVRFLLLVIDTFTKKIWIKPLQNKKAQSVLVAFKKFYPRYSSFPNTLTTDKGSEFQNRLVRNFFETNDVNYYTSEGNTKAQFAERAIRSFKHILFQYLSLNQTDEYINVLNRLVQDYNNTIKSNTGLSPNQVNERNAKYVFVKNNQGDVPDIINKFLKPPKQKTILNIGDYVRIKRTVGPFAKRYNDTFSTELFKITNIIKSNPLRFKLKDLKDEPIRGIFYENELQKSTSNDDITIDKILKEKHHHGVKFSYVKWKYYPRKFNSFIPSSSLKKI